MNPPPFSPPVVPDRDADHLRLLSIFHYVIAGFGVFGMCFLGLHFTIMNAAFTNASNWEDSAKGGPPPEAIMDILKWVYLFLGLLIIAGIVLNVLTATSLSRRRNRTLCFVTAGLNCLQFPLGTLLGVFTIIVLSRESVRLKFAVSGMERVSS